mmetsp:Transcript_83341/g.152992  ORF Transcript_83341/g.152992 Transcript_83341/m.152992 type:complete len:275 (-) Transcript_83341:62-886(-)
MGRSLTGSKTSFGELFTPSPTSMTMMLDSPTLLGRWNAWLQKMRLRKKVHRQTHAVHVIEAFIESHCRAQTQVASYFGEGREVDSPEEAFVIIESQCQVFEAAAKRILVDKRLAVRVSTMWEVEQISKQYREYIFQVHNSGVLRQKEAECLLHPLEDGMRQLHKERRKHFKALDFTGSEKDPRDFVGKKCTDKVEAAEKIQKKMRQYLKVLRAYKKHDSEALIQATLCVEPFSIKSEKSIKNIDGCETSCLSEPDAEATMLHSQSIPGVCRMHE